MCGLFLVLLPASLPASDVVFAAYNVENYLLMDRVVERKKVPNAPKPESEIAAVIAIIKEVSPDILGLTEMGERSSLQDIQARLKAVGLDYPHSEWVLGADAARHIALLSRFPITARNSQDNVPFELDGQQRRMARGLLDVSVRLSESMTLRLVGLHLKSRRQVPDFDQGDFRAKEALCVRRHLDRILTENPNEKVLLFGDLNDTKNELPIREILGPRKSPAHMRDIFLLDQHGQRWTHFWAAADIYSRIDYLLASRALWPLIDSKRSGISPSRTWYLGSDHRLIYATISVP